MTIPNRPVAEALLLEQANKAIHGGGMHIVSDCEHCMWAVQFIVDAMDRMAHRIVRTLEEAVNLPEPQSGERGGRGGQAQEPRP